jgi:serine/threonine protein kinase
MSGATKCPECGSEVAATTTEGLCPKCLMAVAMGVGDDPANGSDLPPTMQSKQRYVPPSAESLARSFPQLEILETLGHGGMGAVYKARQKKLDRIVALKIVRPDTADDPMFTVRFDREAKTLARLNHPNIVSVYDFGDVEYIDDNGKPAGVLYYFLMEFVDGVNLRRLIQSGETKSEQALPIVMQICEALQYAHDQGVVHRDIKPENILLDSVGRLKIADFGLAKLGSETDEQHLTGTMQVLGTVQYMAPEQMTQSKAVDHRADIYSMGVVFYEMLTGEIPVGAFEPPSQRAAIDDRLDEVVMKALASDPDRRFQHARDVGSRISTISSHGGSAPQPEEQAHWPGPSTIMENGVAALAVGVKNIFSPDEFDHADNLGKTHVTLPLKQLDSESMPDVCIVCGKVSRRRASHEFEHCSEAAGWVIVILMVLFFPVGILAAIMLTRKVRASLPVCGRHRNHWSRMAWFAGLGWLLIPLGVLLAFWTIGFAPSSRLNEGPQIGIFVSTIVAGIAAYVVPLIYLASTRVTADHISDKTITLKRVSVGFAREAMRMNSAQASSSFGGSATADVRS